MIYNYITSNKGRAESMLLNRYSKLIKSNSTRRFSSAHGTAKEFETRWVEHFKTAEDLFEVQRGLNNCFGYDIVPTFSMVVEAMKAARKFNDFPTTVRIFTALRDKVENKNQYQEYVSSLEPLIEELGLVTPEDLDL